MMLVYRIEGPNGQGPFRSAARIERMDRAGGVKDGRRGWGSWHNSEGLLAPYAQGGPFMSSLKRSRVGVQSLDLLRRWFPAKIRAVLEDKFFIATYEVSEVEWESNIQVVFTLDKAKCIDRIPIRQFEGE